MSPAASRAGLTGYLLLALTARADRPEASGSWQLSDALDDHVILSLSGPPT
jgi:hypothetical protein